MVLQPFFKAFGSFIYILTLFPILLGLGDSVAWSAPWFIIFSTPLRVLVMIIVMVILTALTPFRWLKLGIWYNSNRFNNPGIFWYTVQTSSFS